MRLTVMCLGFTLIALSAFAQQDIGQLRQTAQTFQRQGDYANALLVLNRALQQEPHSLEVQTDIAYLQFLQRDFGSAKASIGPLLDREDAEVRTFQVAGNIYKGVEEINTCEKMYRKGLKKFPLSGALHAELGELLWVKKEPEDAIRSWENGIRVDPSHSGNYYHASKYYYAIADKVWSILYGEIFVNLESYSTRTAEIKSLLLASYKKFFTPSDLFKQYDAKKKSAFEQAFLETLNKQAPLAVQGITTSSLTVMRTRFILDWFDGHSAMFPHRMLDQQQYYIREGMYEAYNQWLFGGAHNALEYQQWVKNHPAEQERFNYYQKNRVFKMPSGQYYGPSN